MIDEYESFTVVFEGDIRKLPGNPHKLDTSFGKIRSIGVGDAFKALDAGYDDTAQTPPPQSHVVPDDESLWRFWNEKAQELAAENDRLRASLRETASPQTMEEIHQEQLDRPRLKPAPSQHVAGPQPCGIADPSTRDCPNMKEVGGGMDGERYRCAVCGKGYFLDYEEMK